MSASASMITFGGPQKRKTNTTTTHYAWRKDEWVPVAKTEVEEEYDYDPPPAPAIPYQQPPSMPYVQPQPYQQPLPPYTVWSANQRIN